MTSGRKRNREVTGSTVNGTLWHPVHLGDNISFSKNVNIEKMKI
jgi:hypothetical protein